MSVRYLVMPRGINVGTRNRVPMAHLRSELAEAGYAEVATVLQSGNLIVTASSEDSVEVGHDIERLLGERFNVSVPCAVRTAADVQRVLEKNPLSDIAVDLSKYLVIFLSDEPDPDAARSLAAEDHSPEVLAIEGREAYVWTPEGVKAMHLSYSYLEKQFDVVATARNWNTLKKIADKL